MAAIAAGPYSALDQLAAPQLLHALTRPLLPQQVAVVQEARQCLVRNSIECHKIEPNTRLGGGTFEIGEEVQTIRRPNQKTVDIALIPTAWIGERVVNSDPNDEIVGSEVSWCRQPSATNIECSLRIQLSAREHCRVPIYWRYRDKAWRATYLSEDVVCSA